MDKLTAELEIIRRASDWLGSVSAAQMWYRAPVPAFEGQTPEQMVNDVRRKLSAPISQPAASNYQ